MDHRTNEEVIVDQLTELVECTITKKERRRYALLNAAALISAASVKQYAPDDEGMIIVETFLIPETAVDHAEALLAEIERREK